MKKGLKKSFGLIIGGALTLAVMSCSNLFDQLSLENAASIEMSSRARSAVATTDVYNTLSSKSAATTYNSTYDMYTVDGSKLSDDSWYFFKQDLSKYAGKSVTIDFQTSIFVRNYGSAKKLEWVVKSADGYKTIAYGNYNKGESPWGIVSGSGTFNLDSNSCIYLATYGITTSNVLVTIADTSLKVSYYNDSGDDSYTEDTRPEIERTELFSNDISTGSYTSDITIGEYSILATSEKNVSIKNKKASLNGKSFTKTISLNGGGAYGKYRAISFYAKTGYKIRVYAEAGAEGRYLALANSSGIENEKEIATEITSYTYTVKSTGVYNLFSTKNGINIYYVSVIPGTTDVDPINPPEIDPPVLEPPVDDEFVSIKKGNFYTDKYTSYDSETETYMFKYNANNISVTNQPLLKYDLGVDEVGIYEVDFTADINGIIDGDNAEFVLYADNENRKIGSFTYTKFSGNKSIHFSSETVHVSKGSCLYFKNVNENTVLKSITLSNIKLSAKKLVVNNQTTENPIYTNYNFYTPDSIKQGDFYTDSKYTTYDESTSRYYLYYNGNPDTKVFTETLLKYAHDFDHAGMIDVEFSATVTGRIFGEAEFVMYVDNEKKIIGSAKRNGTASTTLNFSAKNVKVSKGSSIILKNVNPDAQILSIYISNVKMSVKETNAIQNPPVEEPIVVTDGYEDIGFITKDSIKQGDFYTDSAYTTYKENINSYTISYPDNINVVTHNLLKYVVEETGEYDIEFSGNMTGLTKLTSCDLVMYVDSTREVIGKSGFGSVATKGSINFSAKAVKITAGSSILLKNVNLDAQVKSFSINGLTFSITKHVDNIENPVDDSYKDLGFYTSNFIKQGDFYTDSECTTYDSKTQSYSFNYSMKDVTTKTLLKYLPYIEGNKNVNVEFSCDVIGVIKNEEAEFALYMNGNERPIGTYHYGKTPGQKGNIKFTITNLKISNGKYFFFKNINENSIVNSLILSNVTITVNEAGENAGNVSASGQSLNIEKPFKTNSFVSFNSNDSSYLYTRSNDNGNIIFESEIGKLFGDEVSGASTLTSYITVECTSACQLAWFYNGEHIDSRDIKLSSGKTRIRTSTRFTYNGDTNSKLELRAIFNPDAIKSILIEKPTIMVFKNN